MFPSQSLSQRLWTANDSQNRGGKMCFSFLLWRVISVIYFVPVENDWAVLLCGTNVVAVDTCCYKRRRRMYSSTFFFCLRGRVSLSILSQISLYLCMNEGFINSRDGENWQLKCANQSGGKKRRKERDLTESKGRAG